MPITGFDEKIKGTLIKVWAVRDYIVIFTVPLPVTAALREPSIHYVKIFFDFF